MKKMVGAEKSGSSHQVYHTLVLYIFFLQRPMGLVVEPNGDCDAQDLDLGRVIDLEVGRCACRRSSKRHDRRSLPRVCGLAIVLTHHMLNHGVRRIDGIWWSPDSLFLVVDGKLVHTRHSGRFEGR